MERKDWALLTVAVGGDDGIAPVVLQKSLFLLGKNCIDVGPDFYNFIPYDYGPFDIAICDDVEKLIEEGLVVKRLALGYRWHNYCLSPAGEKVVDELLVPKLQKTVCYLQSLVTWAQRLTFSQLVSAVCRKYPEMAANSVFLSR